MTDDMAQSPALNAALDAIFADKKRDDLHKDMIGALLVALEFVEDQEDVVDGDYGVPKPNRAMQIAIEIREVLRRAGVKC